MFREVCRRLNLGFALAFGALLLFSHWTGAQVAGGLHGTIRDPSGAPEIFNAFNHANFAPPLDHHAVFDELGNPVSGAGLINSTQTPSRQVQLDLKLIW